MDEKEERHRLIQRRKEAKLKTRQDKRKSRQNANARNKHLKQGHLSVSHGNPRPGRLRSVSNAAAMGL